MKIVTTEELKPREQKFVEAYLLYNLSQWKAAEFAGYKGDRIQLWKVGSKVFNRPRVQEAIKAAMSEDTMSLEEILMRLTEQARNEGMNYVQTDGTVNLLGMMQDGKMHLIKRITPTCYGLKVEFMDSQRALELLGKYHGMFKERLETESQMTVRVVYAEALIQEDQQHDIDIRAED